MKHFRQTPLRILFLLVLQALFAPLLLSQDEPKNTVGEGGASGRKLVPGKALEKSIDLRADGWFETFTFELPDEAFGFRLEIAGAKADLDLFVQAGGPIEDFSSADFRSEDDANNEEMLVTRMTEREFATGKYYVDVVYQGSSRPIVDDERIREIPFSLTLEVILPEVVDTLVSGKAVRATLSPENGMYALFRFDVPADGERLRFDLFDSTGDLDILANYDEVLFTEPDADYVRTSPLGRESLIINGDSPTPLREGPIYIMVFDQVAADYPFEFSIVATLDGGPPGALLPIPEIPVSPDDPLSNAVAATVQISNESGSGSGCLVSEHGHVITNWHTVETASGEAAEETYVAVTLAPELPPAELFRAEVLERDPDHDLALLKITGGLYGQDLPEGYRFPHFQLSPAPPIKLGQDLVVIGYPGVGGSGSRTSVSLSRGILSGFETHNSGRLLKTDAEVNSGNSGGAAVDAMYRLIGLPSSSIAIADDKMSFIEPISQVSASWLEIIAGGE